MSGELSILQSTFRAAMAGVCTPVSVVTTLERGRPHGTTVSAFASLSMTPPMLLVSLETRSDLLAMVERTGAFGVNVLAFAQSALALRFAKKGPEKFRGIPWTGEHGRQDWATLPPGWHARSPTSSRVATTRSCWARWLPRRPQTANR